MRSSTPSGSRGSTTWPMGRSIAPRSASRARALCRPRRPRRFDPKALLHRVALIPDVDVEGGEPRRPFRCEAIDTLAGNPVDVVVESRPRVRSIEWVQANPRLRRPERGGGGVPHVAKERCPCVHASMRASARYVATDRHIPIQPSDLVHLGETVRDVLCKREAAPGHPTRTMRNSDPRSDSCGIAPPSASTAARCRALREVHAVVSPPRRMLSAVGVRPFAEQGCSLPFSRWR
jgi:hypothetical protein